MVRFIHFADLHLDGAFAGFPPEKAAEKRRETRALLSRITELAKSEGAAFILCAGDLFEGSDIYAETLAAARDAFARTELPVFISPGNHDPYGSRSPYAAADWSKNVHIFREAAFERVELPDSGCAVTGFAYTGANDGGRALKGHRAPDSGLFEILLIHGHVAHSAEKGLFFPPEDVAASGYDYMAMGHIHQFAEQRHGKTLAVMSGSVEGRGFDESGERGAVVGEVENGAVRVRLAPLGGSRCDEVRVDVTGLSPRAALEEIAGQAAYPPEKTLLKLVLTGRGGFDTEGLLSLLKGYSAVRVYDKTALPAEERAERSGIAGMFVKRMGEAGESPELRALALEFGLAAFDRGEHPGR